MKFTKRAAKYSGCTFHIFFYFWVIVYPAPMDLQKRNLNTLFCYSCFSLRFFFVVICWGLVAKMVNGMVESLFVNVTLPVCAFFIYSTFFQTLTFNLDVNWNFRVKNVSTANLHDIGLASLRLPVNVSEFSIIWVNDSMTTNVEHVYSLNRAFALCCNSWCFSAILGKFFCVKVAIRTLSSALNHTLFSVLIKKNRGRGAFFKVFISTCVVELVVEKIKQ